MDDRYIHLGDHIRIAQSGHVSIFNISIGDIEEYALSVLRSSGFYYEYDKLHHYIQFDGCYDTIVVFDDSVRHCSLDVVFHFSKQKSCEAITIGHRMSSVFSCTGLRWLADSIELFSDCLKFSHEYKQVSKAGIIQVYKAGCDYVFIELNNDFRIAFYSEKDYHKRLMEEKILPTNIIDNKK